MGNIYYKMQKMNKINTLKLNRREKQNHHIKKIKFKPGKNNSLIFKLNKNKIFFIPKKSISLKKILDSIYFF